MTEATAGLLDAAFTHLTRLSDDTGLFEHARYATPRREHGYCLDDVARGLVVLCRQPPSWHLAGSSDPLAERYLAFAVHAQSSDGRFRNRLGFDRLADAPGLGDWWAGHYERWALPRPAHRCPGCVNTPCTRSTPASSNARPGRVQGRSGP